MAGPRLQESEHRLILYKRYGPRVQKELKNLKGRNYFLVKDVTQPGAIKCLAHLTERTRHQYISDLCTEMQVRGVLGRNGRTFFFIKKKVKEK